MGGNSPIRYAVIERALRRGGAVHTRTRGSHHNWTFRGRAFTIVVHNNVVKAPYIKRLREFWSLAPQDGVSDKDFWDGKWTAG
jgi:predicted RNA binding protein YcfA (HicA-like mRNA interferase family)